MDHSATALTPFLPSLCSKAAQWPKQEPAADHRNSPTWSSKLITTLCRMEVLNAPDGCQPTALLERHWQLCHRDSVVPCSQIHKEHAMVLLSAELSWFSLEPESTHVSVLLFWHIWEKAVPTDKGSSFSTAGLEALRDKSCHTRGTANMGGKVPEPKMIIPVENCQHPQLGQTTIYKIYFCNWRCISRFLGR